MHPYSYGRLPREREVHEEENGIVYEDDIRDEGTNARQDESHAEERRDGKQSQAGGPNNADWLPLMMMMLMNNKGGGGGTPAMGDMLNMMKGMGGGGGEGMSRMLEMMNMLQGGGGSGGGGGGMNNAAMMEMLSSMMGKK